MIKFMRRFINIFNIIFIIICIVIVTLSVYILKDVLGLVKDYPKVIYVLENQIKVVP